MSMQPVYKKNENGEFIYDEHGNKIIDIRYVQLNEKTAVDEYQILHPETDANYVIEHEDKQFVSQEEKDRWDNTVSTISEEGLLFKETWDKTKSYEKNNVVLHNDRYFICAQDHDTTVALTQRRPDPNANTAYWLNINFSSYKADQAEAVKISASANTGTKSLLLNDGSNNQYQSPQYTTDLTFDESKDTLTVGSSSNKVTIDGSTGTVTANKFVGELDGKASDAEHADLADRATEAEKYVKYDRNADGTLKNGIRTEVDTPYIDDAVSGLQEQIDAITSGTGGAVLANKLTVKKDGVQVAQFDGSQAVDVDIKQSYSTEEITDLLDTNKKIQEKWLPDSVLGQLSYKGTWNPALKGTVTPIDGDYYIAKGTGRYLPDGTTLPTDEDDFQTGDWAVYNGTSWDKIDNSDAVRMVNGQIGDVETYKLEWKATNTYHRGDIVKHDNMIYICNSDHTSATSFETDATRWDLFGRTYTGTDAIKVENGVIKHDVTLETGTTVSTTLSSGESFSIPSITRDAFGHVTKLDVKTITLGNDFIDTTREIKLNGTTILTGSGANKNKALDVAGSSWINVKYENDKLNFEHKVIDASKAVNDYTAEKLTDDTEAEELYAGQGYTIPSFKTDAAGHVVVAEMKKFRLADSMIKHNHFNIVKDQTGAQTIQAYSASTATSTWVGTAANATKFYLGAINPTNTTQMNLNAVFNATKLLQGGNGVLDNTMKLYSGVDYAGNALLGSYNVTENRIEMANAVASGGYSAVEVNAKGIVVAGGQIIEFGREIGADPDPDVNLAVGGLFFRRLA